MLLLAMLSNKALVSINVLYLSTPGTLILSPVTQIHFSKKISLCI